MVDEEGTIARIYDPADQPFDDSVRQAMAAFRAEHPRGRFGGVLSNADYLGLDRDPHADGYDGLDTEGRHFVLFVMRFLQPDSAPELPTVRCVPLDDLTASQ